MSDIELVVKIPEKAYELLKNKGVDIPPNAYR